MAQIMKLRTAIALSLFSLYMIPEIATADRYRDRYRRDGGYYEVGGPRMDYEFRRVRAGSRICRDKYSNDGRYQACDDGKDAAERVAERYAGYNGRVEGYLRGFSWGLYKEARHFENDFASFQEGAQNVDSLRDHINEAVREARREGRERGISAARQMVYSRFSEAAERSAGREPSRDYQAPYSSFSSNSDPYTARVGRVPTLNELIRNEREIRYGDFPVYDNSDYYEYLGDRGRSRHSDMWFDDGIYRTHRERWATARDGWRAFNDYRSFDRRRYDRLGTLTIRVPNPKFGQTPSDPNAPAEPKFINKVIELKDVFREGFDDNYPSYAEYYFDTNFEQELDNGVWDGRELGERLGKRLAYYRGLRNEFNEIFFAETDVAYQEAFKQAFDPSSGTAVQYHDALMDRPELSFVFHGLEGAVNDGILVPGEKVKARLTVKNIGGQSGNFTLGLEGRLNDNGTQTLQIGALSKTDYTSDFLARIAESVQAREDIGVTLLFNDQRSRATSYKIRQLAEIVRYRPSLDPVHGKGTVRVLVQNISNQKLPSTLELLFKVNDNNYSRATVPMLEGGMSQELTFYISEVDPFKLIAGNIKTEAVLSMGSKKFFNMSEVVGVPSQNQSLVDYWDALLNRNGFVPSSTSWSSRKNEVRSRLLRANIEQIERFKQNSNSNLGGYWRTNPSLTIVGMLQDKRLRYPVVDRRGRVSGNTSIPYSKETVENYHSLGRSMIGEADRFQTFLGMSHAKSNYKDIVEVLARGTDGRF